jgi:hypothetical protein
MPRAAQERAVRRVLAYGAIVGATWAWPGGAYVCTRTSESGPSVAWDSREVTMRRAGRGAEVDEDAFDEALAKATSTWTRVGCSDLLLSIGPTTTSRLVGFDWHAGLESPLNENLVVFRDDDASDPLDAWVHSPGAIAITTITFDDASGALLDADIEFNDSAFSFSTCDPDQAGCVVGFDVENTLTHELGHVVGLDHPPPSDPFASEATMFASAPQGDTSKRTLSADDEAGLCALYPAGVKEPGECYGVAGKPTDLQFEQVGCQSTLAVDAGWGLGFWAVLAARGLVRPGPRRRNGPSSRKVRVPVSLRGQECDGAGHDRVA